MKTFGDVLGLCIPCAAHTIGIGDVEDVFLSVEQIDFGVVMVLTAVPGRDEPMVAGENVGGLFFPYLPYDA